MLYVKSLKDLKISLVILIRMQPKYLVSVFSESGDISEDSFTTRQEIVSHYKIPLYIVDKMIKLTNDPKFTTKRNSHRIYNDLVNSMTIHLIKPTIGS